MAADASVPVKRLYLASLVTLLTGLSVSATLYMSAADVADNALVEEFRKSKVFRRDLELYGGKMSLMGEQFNHWFTGLWQGRQLGITIGCISVTIALALLCVARLNRDQAPVPGAGKETL